MKYLVDTCVISEFTKPSPCRCVTDFFFNTLEEKIFICTMSLAELHRGIQKLDAGKKQTQLFTWLDALEAQFAKRVLCFDEACAATWGTMCVTAERRGKKLSTFDSLIAAVARAHNLALVTRNTSDFSQTDLELINPFS